MEKYQHIQNYKIKYCDVDFKDELKTSSALAYLEEVACLSADELGFGYSFVKKKNCSFMVTNLCLEFIRPVLLGEDVKIKTWPLPPSNFVFGREYQMVDESENVVVNASSRWCLVDVGTGKLVPSKIIENQDYSTYNTDKALENVVWKIPVFELSEGVLAYSFKVANSEYDHNMHVNNTRYADYCFNCFSVSQLSKKRLKKFSIAYKKQCREGETLSFYKKACEGGFLIQGVNEGLELVVQAQIIFEE